MSKIGIFVKNNDSVFSNGCIQQAYFTYKSIKAAGYNVEFLTTDIDCKRFEIIGEDVIYICSQIDILKQYKLVIFSSLIVHQYSVLNILKLYGVKIAHLIVGNYYILNCEEFVFNVHTGIMDKLCNDYVDEVWLMPMYKHAIGYIKAITKKPVKISPYVWDSTIISNYSFKNDIQPSYKDITGNKLSILVMEPNMSVHKNALPILCAINSFFIKNPEKIDLVYVLCKPKNPNILKTISMLDIVRANKIRFYPRAISVEIFSQMNEINSKYCVISGNIRNELNFLHLECMHLDIPIIHNCIPFKDNGLYYEDSDNNTSYDIIENHLFDIYHNKYNKSNDKIRKIIEAYSCFSDLNTNGYKKLIDSLAQSYKPSIDTVIRKLGMDYTSGDGCILGTGIVITININYNIDIISRNILNISNSGLEVTFYIQSSVYDMFINDLSRILTKLGEKIIDYKTVTVYDNQIDAYALSHSWYENIIFMKQNIICTLDVKELESLLINGNNMISFDISSDIYEVEKIIHFLKQVDIYCNQGKSNIKIFDNCFFCYKNNHNLKSIFKNYVENSDLYKQFIDNRFIIHLLFIYCGIDIKTINTKKGSVYNEFDEQELLMGYYHESTEKNKILYINLDTECEKSFIYDRLLFMINRKSYQYCVKDSVFRNTF